MVSWFMTAACALGGVAAAVLAIWELRTGRLVAIKAARRPGQPARAARPPRPSPAPRDLRRSDGVVWESVSAHFATHRQQCTGRGRCAECRVYRDVLSGLLDPGGGPPARSALESKVTEALGGHVPDEAGLCRACVSGRFVHGRHDRF